MFVTLPSWAAAVVSTPFKRAQTGLYHGVMKQSGNNVPFSKGKTRRTWLPNVHNKTFFSETFQKNVRVKVSMKALKTIKKNGGIDNYLRKTKPSLLGDEGMRLRISLEEAAKKRRTEKRQGNMHREYANAASTPPEPPLEEPQPTLSV